MAYPTPGPVRTFSASAVTMHACSVVAIIGVAMSAVAGGVVAVVAQADNIIQIMIIVIRLVFITHYVIMRQKTFLF